jgi:protein-tyrosine phosphatase
MQSSDQTHIDVMSTYLVCFVCTGNICRSPMAEWVTREHLTRAALADRVSVESAGTGGWHIGQGADPRAVRTLNRRGYSCEHTARQFERSWLTDRDLVIALDTGHLRTLQGMAREGRTLSEPRLLRAFDPGAGPEELDVPDPYYGSMAGFEVCLDMIEAAMPGLVEHIGAALDSRAASEKGIE